jgi:hypothetical protein
VASSLYKVIQAVGTADVTTPSSSSSSSSASSGGSSLAHECYFYTDKNFSYTSSTEAFLGYSNLSKGLYYLVNATTNIGNVYDIETPLETKRSVAQQIINDDYSAISLAYDEMKSFVGKTPAEMNVSSFSLLHSDIGATVGYQLRFRTDGDTTYTDTYSYITLNKTGDGTFAFTDYVRRVLEYLPPINGPLAQLVEQLTLNQRVAGSSPSGITIETKRQVARPAFCFTPF